MPNPSFNFAKPDQGASKEAEPRVLTIAFGDGYSQDAADGINNVVETWTVTFSGRTKYEIDTIDAFLKGLAGYLPFNWNTPDGLTKTFKCKKWSTTYNHELDASLTATFTQRFGP